MFIPGHEYPGLQEMRSHARPCLPQMMGLKNLTGLDLSFVARAAFKARDRGLETRAALRR